MKRETLEDLIHLSHCLMPEFLHMEGNEYYLASCPEYRVDVTWEYNDIRMKLIMPGLLSILRMEFGDRGGSLSATFDPTFSDMFDLEKIYDEADLENYVETT